MGEVKKNIQYKDKEVKDFVQHYQKNGINLGTKFLGSEIADMVVNEAQNRARRKYTTLFDL